MNMKLKELMGKLGAQPGQVVSDPFVRAFVPQQEAVVTEEEDHEVFMAQKTLDDIIKNATELKTKIGEAETDLPAWIQDHISNSANYIDQAASGFYKNESINEEEIKWNAVENAIINFLKMNTKILDKRVKDRDTAGVKGGLKSIISGLTNAQRSLKLESLNEGRGLKTLAKELSAVADHIQGYVEIYKRKKGTPDAKKIVDKLKQLNAEKKELERRMDVEVSSLYRDAELQLEEKTSVNEAFEVHYSDGMRASKKFGNERQAIQFAKDLIKNKKGLQFVDVFNAGSGFHSTADTDAIVAWWGKGSFTDNKSKKDSKLAAKKIKEDVVSEQKPSLTNMVGNIVTPHIFGIAKKGN